MTMQTSGDVDPAVPVRHAGRLGGVALMLGSGLSNQAGASVAALAFPVIGPLGVVAVRQWVAAAVLCGVGRPRMRSFTAAQWRRVLALAVVFAAMNLSLYTAVDRVGLGLAVTLEFLGPLAVALIGSRRRTDVLCALAVAAALVVLDQHLDAAAWTATLVIVAANAVAVGTGVRQTPGNGLMRMGEDNTQFPRTRCPRASPTDDGGGRSPGGVAGGRAGGGSATCRAGGVSHGGRVGQPGTVRAFPGVR